MVEAALGEADRVVAEAWGAGIVGLEERSEEGGITLLLYATAERAENVRRVLCEVLGSGARVGVCECVEDVDWSQAWKAGIEAVEVSERLVVRPSFLRFDLRPGQEELVIDPGRAFGTGGHASTLLALQWIDRLHARLGPATRVLDVGLGTGVLALAALRLGAGSAVGFDIDLQAVREARVWARRNDLSERLRSWAGPVEALAAGNFDLVLANLLRVELLPIAGALVEALRPGGHAVLSGLLSTETPEVEAVMRARGLSLRARRSLRDARGDDWAALLMVR